MRKSDDLVLTSDDFRGAIIPSKLGISQKPVAGATNADKDIREERTKLYMERVKSGKDLWTGETLTKIERQ